jgi:hypothetical protein
MSHMVVMNVPKIKNMKSLERACKSLGLTLNMEKKQAQYWAGNKMQCDGVISCPGSSYEIALKKESDGSYSMQMDNYCPKLSGAVGRSGGKLSQHYQIEEHKRAARNAGKEIAGCNVLPNGTIELQIRG